MRLPIQVIVYVARLGHDGWEYLMLHRLPNPRIEIFWQGVSGGVEEGETFQLTAERELAEETGLAGVAVRSIDYWFSFPARANWKALWGWDVTNIVAHVYVAVADRGFVPVLEEHDEFKWCALDEALETLYWDGDKEALRRAAAWLEANIRS